MHKYVPSDNYVPHIVLEKLRTPQECITTFLRKPFLEEQRGIWDAVYGQPGQVQGAALMEALWAEGMTYI